MERISSWQGRKLQGEIHRCLYRSMLALGASPIRSIVSTKGDKR
jgi:hypothetical protein